MTPDFLNHLEEFRKRLIVSIAAFLLCSIAAYFFSHQILNFLIAPLKRFHPVDLVFQRPYEAFLIHIKAATIIGFLAASPVLFTQAWLFIKPGLYEHEKKLLTTLSLSSIVFFMVGAAFAYWVAIPYGLDFLLSYQTENLKPFIGVEAYFSFLTGMAAAFGLLFDFPIILIGLIKLRVIRTEAIAKARKPIIVVIFILAAVLTPSPDPISQLILAIPLMLLFELSLLGGRFLERRQDSSKR